MTEQNTRTPPEPATDAELVELAAKTFVAEYWEGSRTWDQLQPQERANLKLDISGTVAAIAPAIRAQERAKIVAWLRMPASQWSAFMEDKDHRLPWQFTAATAIEQGVHDNDPA